MVENPLKTKQPVDLRRYEKLVTAAMRPERTLPERATAAMTVSRWEMEGHPASRAPWPLDLLATMMVERLPIEMRTHAEGLGGRILAGHPDSLAAEMWKAAKQSEEAQVVRQVRAMLLAETSEKAEFSDPDYENKKGEAGVKSMESIEDAESVEEEEEEEEEEVRAGDDQDGFTLTEEQATGLNKILTAIKKRQPEIRLSGYAGTGKSTLMRSVARLLRQRGIPFVLLGPTNQAARRLAQLAGSKAGTIHQLIYPRPEETSTGDLVFPAPRIPLNDQKEPVVDPQGVFVVDETSMVDRKVANDLRSLVRGTIIWIGDGAQLPPVGGPPGVDLAHAEVTLKQVHRQAKGSSILGMATQVRQTEWADWDRLSVYGMAQHHNVSYRQSTLDQVASDLLALHRRGKADTVVLAWMNTTRRKINQKYRNLCEATLPLHAGEKLVICMNHYNLGLLNGDIVQVDRVEWVPLPDWLTGCLGQMLGMVWVESRKEPIFVTDMLLSAERKEWSQAIAVARAQIGTVLVEETPNYRAAVQTLNSIVLADYAYCMTVHRFQGSQASTVIVAWTQDWLWNPPRKRPQAEGESEARRKFQEVRCWLYTALTRASDFLQITNIKD